MPHGSPPTRCPFSRRRSILSTGIICGAVDAVKPAADRKGVDAANEHSGCIPANDGRSRSAAAGLSERALECTQVHRRGWRHRSVRRCDRRGRHAYRFATPAAASRPTNFRTCSNDFATVRMRRPVSGLGLGLTIARVLVELHGGTIQIASPGVGQGTTCTIDLPITAKVTAAESVPRAAAPSCDPVRPPPHFFRRSRSCGTAVINPVRSLRRSPTTMPFAVTS